MIRKSFIAFVTASALAMGAMAQDAGQSGQGQSQQDQSMQGQTQQDQSQQQAGAQMGAGMEAVRDATSQNPDLAFAAVLISHARLQAQISEMVAQKATNPQIKQLAQSVMDDHQKFSQRVQDAAKKEGLTLHPDRLLPRDQAIITYMQQLPVSSLERNYVFFEAGTNQTNLLLSQWAANNAQKPEIKQVAQEIASKLQQRNQTIQQLAQAEISGGGAQPAGGQMTPGSTGGGSTGGQ